MVNYNQIVALHYFQNGDIKTDNWLFEAKTCMKEQDSFSIKKEWLDKLKNESFAMQKEFFALVFNFGYKNQRKFLYIK